MDRIHQTWGKWERWYFSADFFAPQTWWIAELEMQISTDELASLHHSHVREISDTTCVDTGKYPPSVHCYFLMFQPLLHVSLFLFIYLLFTFFSSNINSTRIDLSFFSSHYWHQLLTITHINTPPILQLTPNEYSAVRFSYHTRDPELARTPRAKEGLSPRRLSPLQMPISLSLL